MTETTTVEPAPATAATDEVELVATLQRLNAEYIRALVEGDTTWYDENLSDDFVCSLADGRRIDKHEFLLLNAERPPVVGLSCDDVDVRLFGDVALVQGVTHSVRGGVPASIRYTDVWHRRGERWVAVAAHLTRVASS
jgi:Domain of unknown function (DUF4440)